MLLVLACARARRPHQRPPRRGGADRLLHRHARHRHHALRARALAHRRPPDRRRRCRTGFIALNTTSVLGIPIPALYVIALAIVLWIVSERLPLGRHIYAIGANEKAAALNGIPVRRYVIGVFVASGADRRLRRLHPRREAAHRPGQCRPRLPAAGAGRRLPRLDHDQAGAGQRLGHDVRRSHPRRRHLRHPAARRRLLRRAAVQRHDAGRLHRARRLRAASSGDRASRRGGDRRIGLRGRGRRRCRPCTQRISAAPRPSLQCRRNRPDEPSMARQETTEGGNAYVEITSVSGGVLSASAAIVGARRRAARAAQTTPS